jgi:hypothetical protein
MYNRYHDIHDDDDSTYTFNLQGYFLHAVKEAMYMYDCIYL